jgi:hypothetical protein
VAVEPVGAVVLDVVVWVFDPVEPELPEPGAVHHFDEYFVVVSPEVCEPETEEGGETVVPGVVLADVLEVLCVLEVPPLTDGAMLVWVLEAPPLTVGEMLMTGCTLIIAVVMAFWRTPPRPCRATARPCRPACAECECVEVGVGDVGVCVV